MSVCPWSSFQFSQKIWGWPNVTTSIAVPAEATKESLDIEVIIAIAIVSILGLTLELAHHDSDIKSLALELAFQDSDIKSLALKMTFKKREPDVWSRRKAYRP